MAQVVQVSFSDEEYDVLCRLAEQEMRTPADQIRWLVKCRGAGSVIPPYLPIGASGFLPPGWGHGLKV